MLVFSQNLNRTLSRVIAFAERQCYECATPEHVLLGLIDDPDAIPVMQACNVDLEKLRSAVLASMPHLYDTLDPDESEDVLDSDGPDEALNEDKMFPVEHFQVVLQRAIAHARSSGCEEVNSADVLVAVLERPVGDILNRHGMTRYDVTTFICHGISKGAQATSLHGGAIDRPAPQSPSGDTMGASMFSVRLLNDNYTPMGFVVHVLEKVFELEPEDAERVMLEIHREGAGACGTFTREEAEARAAQVLDLARQHQHPLRCCVQELIGQQPPTKTDRERKAK